MSRSTTVSALTVSLPSESSLKVIAPMDNEVDKNPFFDWVAAGTRL